MEKIRIRDGKKFVSGMGKSRIRDPGLTSGIRNSGGTTELVQDFSL
jgi:hypothetical protein